MVHKHSARPLVEGAMLAALTVLLSFIPVAMTFIPVPLIVLVYRYDLRLGILAAVTAALLAGMISGIFTGFVPLLIVGLVGIAIGGALLENFSPYKVLFVGTLAFLISTALTIALSSLVFGENLIELVLKGVEQGFTRAFELYEKMGVTNPLALPGENGVKTLVDWFRVVLPAGFIASSVVLTFINYWAARLILKRTGAELEWFPPFRTWSFPWYLAWGYILGLGMALASPYVVSPVFRSLGANIQILFTYVFLLQGLAVIWFYLDKVRMTKALRYVILFFVITNPLLSQLLVLGGVLDIWFNFRKLENKFGRD